MFGGFVNVQGQLFASLSGVKVGEFGNFLGYVSFSDYRLPTTDN
jgi:hypothetical protein